MSFNKIVSHGAGLIVAVSVACLLSGCGGGSTEKSFQPAGDAARTALTKALEAWKGGQEKSGPIKDATPAVSAAVPAWNDGAKLTAFEIVQDLEGGESTRKFKVKLTIEGEAAPIEVTYVVVGKDPLWVMPEDQHQRNTDM